MTEVINVKPSKVKKDIQEMDRILYQQRTKRLVYSIKHDVAIFPWSRWYYVFRIAVCETTIENAIRIRRGLRKLLTMMEGGDDDTHKLVILDHVYVKRTGGE